jgi:alpha-tubulin suppressor-like RCC1 family protein
MLRSVRWSCGKVLAVKTTLPTSIQNVHTVQEADWVNRRRAGIAGRLAVIAALALMPCLGFSAAAGAQVLRWGAESNNEEQTTPVGVTGLPEIPTTIDAGNRTSYALEPNGTEYAWGSGTHGELGNNSGEHSDDVAVKVQFPAGVHIVAIGEARASGFAIDSTGQGWGWGEGGAGIFCSARKNITLPTKVPGITDATAVQGGETHVLWLLANGTVVGCGSNNFGELGLGRSIPETETAQQVPDLSHVVEISAGERHTLARTSTGKVFAFGSNEEGQACQPERVNKVFTPTEVRLPGPASDISGGGNHPFNGHSLFLVEGVPYGCGDDSSGQIGDGQTSNKFTPTVASEVLTLGLTKVVAAGEASMGLSSSGEVYTWGSAEAGDLGNGSDEGFSLSPVPVASEGLEVSATAHNMITRTRGAG